jgi:hypothetical protein
MTKIKNARFSLWLFAIGVLALSGSHWNMSRADDSKAIADAFIGKWKTVVDGKDKFTLTLEQGRRGLYGSYTPGNGQAIGRVYEGVLRLRCYEDGKPKSTALLKLSEDGKSFTGSSKTDGEDKEHSWEGKRE